MSPVLNQTPEPTFSPVGEGRAFDEISLQIRSAMAAGQLRPGSRLPAERTLSAQFGVSRNTLREALRSLESSGVLVLRRGGQAGAYIQSSDGLGVATGLLDMYKLGGISPAQLTDARIVIESAIVRAACLAADEDDLEALRANLRQAVLYDQGGLAEDRIRTNLEFHRLIARATKNPLLMTFMDATLDVLQIFIRTLGPYNARSILGSRRRFIKLLAERDADAAVAEMEASLRLLQKRYLSRMNG
jgi:GntR family transcriptional repressor for pyruvate dehydrogenase complex